MSCRSLVKLSLGTAAACALALALGCASKPTKAATKPAPPIPPAAVVPAPPAEILPPVMLGIDVLEADKFAAIAGKKIGLLTHSAGVNRRGESTINVLLRVPNAKLVALFAPEHGLDGQIKAEVRFGNSVHIPTGLPVYSVHGVSRKPSPAMLKGLDAVVVDLQDIGVRSYTFVSAMAYMMAACFENNVEVIVLDRPNPLGGLKVDGPPLDADLKSYVGVFRVPYVHGLTMGELAHMAKDAPGVLFVPGPTGINVTDKVRNKGRLTVVPMRGWTRAMRWPETGLHWIPTSPMVPDFEAVVGYAMVGLGCEQTEWRSGIGRDFPFRGILFRNPKKTPDEIIAAMDAYHIPGIRLVKRQGLSPEGKIVSGVYVEVSDWEAWHPTELSFYMHKQAATWLRMNPFATLTIDEQRTFQIHVGSREWFNYLAKSGGKVDVSLFLKNWAERATAYQQQSKKYWLYP